MAKKMTKKTSKVSKKASKKKASKKKAAVTNGDTPLIEVGKKAPSFKSVIQDGSDRSLQDYKDKWLILYFYPKDDTPGCTKEACAFRDHLPDFSKLEAEILGVSPDSETKHQKFITKHALNFDLLADTDQSICKKYGVWQEKNMYGRKYWGVVRTTYLINPQGKIVYRWDKVKVANHIEDVLQVLNDQL